MKLTLFTTLLLMLCASFLMPDTQSRKVVFFGDSITQAAIEAKGYISQMRALLEKKGKTGQFELKGAGISGNKVPDLQARLSADVLAQKPNLVFVYIGINDVWHSHHECCKNNGGGTSLVDFRAGLTDVVKRIQSNGAKVVICTPTVIGEKHDGSNELDGELDKYAQVSREVALATQSQLCDLRKTFIRYLKKHNKDNSEKDVLTYDGVHLNEKGNALVAETMLRFLK